MTTKQSNSIIKINVAEVVPAYLNLSGGNTINTAINTAMKMKVTIKQWTPNGGNFERYYVSNETGESLGFIQLNLKSNGYGTGYYGRHRATKGDFGVETVSNVKVEGNEAALTQIVELAKSRHPELDVALTQMSINTKVIDLRGRTKIKNKADVTFEIVEVK